MQKITPFFWFNNQAEEAAKFYVDIFNGNPGRKKKSKLGDISRYGEASAKVSGQPAGSVMTVSFFLEGEEFTAINGGPPPEGSGWGPMMFSPTSFVINCKTQAEVDWFWEKLSEGGTAGICGWIYHDKFGLTWQVVPTILTELLNDKDAKKAERVMEAMLKMTKIEIAELERAAKEG